MTCNYAFQLQDYKKNPCNEGTLSDVTGEVACFEHGTLCQMDLLCHVAGHIFVPEAVVNGIRMRDPKDTTAQFVKFFTDYCQIVGQMVCWARNF